MAAAGPTSPKYPKKLTAHLKGLSQEKSDECKIYKEWNFSHTEDSGAADQQCPCGKIGIRYLCYIDNNFTKKKTFIGTSCVEFFDDDMKEVLGLVLGLISQGITGKFKGEGTGRNKKQRFEIRANTKLVKKESRLKALFKHVPIYKKRNGKWEIQVFNTWSSQARLQYDQRYSMMIRTARWEKSYGTGISFYTATEPKKC